MPTRKGVASVSDVLAENLRGLRITTVGGMSQQQVADRMTALGFGWSRVTVTEVEASRRRVTLEELIALARIFSTPIGTLLVPPDGRDVALTPALIVHGADVAAILATGNPAVDPEGERLRLRLQSAEHEFEEAKRNFEKVEAGFQMRRMQLSEAEEALALHLETLNKEEQ